MLLGIDRLDPIKGIPHKLLAFERLLEDHPEYVGEVCHLAVVVRPARLSHARGASHLRPHAHEVVHADMPRARLPCVRRWCAFASQVVLVQIAVPSRLDVALHRQLQQRLHLLVGRINGRFGTLGSVPIHYLDTSVSFAELVAL